MEANVKEENVLKLILTLLEQDKIQEYRKPNVLLNEKEKVSICFLQFVVLSYINMVPTAIIEKYTKEINDYIYDESTFLLLLYKGF